MTIPHAAWRAVKVLVRTLIQSEKNPEPTRRAIRSASAMAVGIIVCSVLMGPQAGSLGTMGALTADVGHETPMRRRAVTFFVVGAATFLCEAIGVWISPYPAIIPPVMTAVTFIVIWVWHALLTGPPGPINVVFAAAFGIYMGANGWGVWQLLEPTIFAWAVSGAFMLTMLAIHPHETERDAVAQAALAVSRYTSMDPDADEASLGIARSRACISVNRAWQVLRAGRLGMTSTPLTRMGRDLEQQMKDLHLELMLTLDRDSFPVDALNVSKVRRITPDRMPSVRYLLRTAFLRGSRPGLVASRAAIAVLLATSTMFILPFGRPYWAILSAIIVLHMGASRADLTIRAYHRVVGTLLGVLLYVGIVASGPSMWTRVLIVIITVYGMEIWGNKNYAVCVVFVTVFALIMFPVASQYELSILMRDRLGETVVGVACALIAIWFVGLRAPVLLVRRQYRMTLNRTRDVLRDLANSDLTSPEAHTRRQLLIFELGRSSDVLSSATQDDPHGTDRWMDVQRAVSRFGFAVVTACWREPGTTTVAAMRAEQQLEDVIDSLPPISTTNIDVSPIVTSIEKIRVHFAQVACQ
ncbi:FUSC family protein [Actinomyces vulturis]|uniref:FUSC family protein n=1 Tax=Actinomyces vulturis TaxID=1857645 RepID=UPI000A83B1EC|nr:FUSC family protein [Actinomyces vulturis]